MVGRHFSFVESEHKCFHKRPIPSAAKVISPSVHSFWQLVSLSWTAWEDPRGTGGSAGKLWDAATKGLAAPCEVGINPRAILMGRLRASTRSNYSLVPMFVHYLQLHRWSRSGRESTGLLLPGCDQYMCPTSRNRVKIPEDPA